MEACPQYQPHSQGAYNWFSLSMSLITLAITGLIIYSYLIYKTRLTDEFKLITYLAITDFFFAVGYLPIFWINTKFWCVFQGFLLNMTTTGSLFWTLLITRAMYLSTVSAYRRHQIYSSKNMCKMLACGYLIPLALSILPLITDSYGKAGLWCWIQNGSGHWGRIWGIIMYGFNFGSIIITVVLYVIIWNWMDNQANEQERSNIKLISLFPLVNFITIYQGTLNRLYDFSKKNFCENNFVESLFWVQGSFDFLSRIILGLMFGLSPIILKDLKYRCRARCCRNSSKISGRSNSEVIPFQNQDRDLLYEAKSRKVRTMY